MNEASTQSRRIYLGLGSNLGDREANLRSAVERIESLGLKVNRASSVYETEPVGYENQPLFLNQVIEVETTSEYTRAVETAVTGDHKSKPDIKPRASLFSRLEQMLSALLNIEREMGRERTIPGGPRAIDIDLLLCGDVITSETIDAPGLSAPETARRDLIVPHPRLHLRRFVLEPLCEIAPELEHPVLKKTCRELLASLADRSVVRPYKRIYNRRY